LSAQKTVANLTKLTYGYIWKIFFIIGTVGYLLGELDSCLLVS